MPKEHGQKILTNYVIHQGAKVEGTLICDTEWPDNCPVSGNSARGRRNYSAGTNNASCRRHARYDDG